MVEEGDKVGSVGDVGKEVNVSVVRGGKGYRGVKEEGFLRSVEGKGRFVNEEDEESEMAVE
ncbi:hypothetical protein [Bacillus altitudinis]|uniref:hypothetical protein n=1 Tax=Bacillus altitudinis TaxID=293387 RepID=UPI0011A6356D|nr:hypothetical protein [Bacillus altitudinis]